MACGEGVFFKVNYKQTKDIKVMCIQTLYPYLLVSEFQSKKENGRPFTNKYETWVFDDAENKLKEEII